MRIEIERGLDHQQTILLVDQQRATADLMRVYLTTDGYDVDYTPFPSEALRFATFVTYDLVITELIMQGMSGVDLYQKIKRRAEKTYFIFLLRVSAENIRLVGSLERDNVIKKEPLSMNEVVGKVKAALSC